MPNKKSAEKELRKSVKRALKNAQVKDKISRLTKQTKKAISSGQDNAKDLLKEAMTALDKAAKTGLIKKNTRDRKKSRLHKKLNAMTKGKK